jgi:hypothetical protein
MVCVQIRNATSHVDLTLDQEKELEGNIASTMIKLIYAFFWQVERESERVSQKERRGEIRGGVQREREKEMEINFINKKVKS